MLSSSENKNGPEGERGWGQASNPKLHRGQACTLLLGYIPAPNHKFAELSWSFVLDVDSGLARAFCSFTSGYWAHTVDSILGSGCYLWWTAVPGFPSQNLLLRKMEQCVWWFWEGFQVIVLSSCFLYELFYLLKGGHSVPNLFLTWHFYPLPLTVCSTHAEPVKLFLFFFSIINNTEEICLGSIVGRWAIWLKYRVEVSYWRIVQVCIIGMFHNLETLVVLAPGSCNHY